MKLGLFTQDKKSGESWRSVPKLDLLAEKSSGVKWVRRMGLGLLVIGGGILFLNLYQEESSVRQEMNEANNHLNALKIELTSGENEVSELEFQLSTLEAQVQAQSGLSQKTTNERWQTALTLLEGLQGEGVQFISIRGTKDGKLTLTATASAQGPLAMLQESLQSMDDPVQVQSVDWTQDETGLNVVVTMQIVTTP